MYEWNHDSENQSNWTDGIRWKAIKNLHFSDSKQWTVERFLLPWDYDRLAQRGNMCTEMVGFRYSWEKITCKSIGNSTRSDWESQNMLKKIEWLSSSTPLHYFYDIEPDFCYCQRGLSCKIVRIFLKKPTINLQFTCTGYALTMHQTIFGMVEANRQ